VGRGWRVGRIAGVDIRVDTSFVIIAIFFTTLQWQFFADRFRFPEIGAGWALGLALLYAVLLFGSVLVHEMAHAAAYRLQGIPVDGVTLWMLGGYTMAKADAPTPWRQFVVAGVGPGASLVLGLAFLAVSAALPRGVVPDVLHSIGWINVLLAGFNALPAFPLDGGRVFRSIVWRITGNPALATRVAARTGQGFGALLAGFGLYYGLSQGDFGRLWLAMIGLFLFQVASSVLSDDRRHAALAGRRIRDMMAPPPPAVPSRSEEHTSELQSPQ